MPGSTLTPVLTPAQVATLKDSIIANTASYPDAVDQRDGPIIAAFYNTLASPDYLVWRSDASVDDALDAIDFSKYTPTDAADTTTIYTNRLGVINIKQMNLQIMLQGRTKINAAKLNIRTALRDAVILIPSGASGANVQAAGAGGVTLMTMLVRKATVFEKLFASSAPTLGGVTANLMAVEGQVQAQQIVDALNS